MLPSVYQIRHFIILYIPLFITQVAQIGTSVFSSIFSGRAGTADLAGVAVAVNIWIPVFAGLCGIFYGVTPIIAQLRGAKKTGAIPDYIMQSLYIALFLSIASIAAGIVVLPSFLAFMKLEPLVEHIAIGYLQALAFGIFPLFTIATLRNVLDAHGKTHLSMLLLVFSLLLCIALFRLFIFGGFGIPAMGGIGTGYAIAVSAWITLFLFLFVFLTQEPFRSYRLFRTLRPAAFIYWSEILRLGVPMAIAIFCETSLFSIVGLFMSEFGTVYLAANQAAISYSSLVYTLPWSISLTATIVVGYEVGAHNYERARQYALLCQLLALASVIFTATVTLLGLDTVASWFTRDADTFRHIRIFITYAVCFSFCDAMGTPVQGILRGYKDVKIITYIAFIAYWIICLPLGYLLAHVTALGAYGYWLGYIIGLAIAAVCYNTRLWKYTAQSYKRSDFNHANKSA